jgi:membrane protease YdiL (CAAX protease family)
LAGLPGSGFDFPAARSRHAKLPHMKIKGLGLVVAIFIVLLVISWAFDTTNLAAIQRQYLHWNYFSHVIMIVLAIGAMAIGKKDFTSYGFTLKKWRSDLSLALICLISAAGYIPSLISPSIAGNRLINSPFIIAAVLLALWLVLSNKNERMAKESGVRIFWPIISIPAIIAVVLGVVGFGIIASTIGFQFYFAGFGEEILFRGYFQSRLNQDFGRPWTVKGVSFGPGLLITAALFGVLHLLTHFNPLMGGFELDLLAGTTSFFAGLLFGLLREKTGTVLSASVGHGLLDLGQVIPLVF